MQNQREDKVKIYAMGGVGEIGNNMTVIEINEDIFIVDAGMMHPKDEMFGVDTVIPDITYLEQNRERVKAIFLTHAHNAHIGGIPYLIKKIKAPIYGTTLTLAILEQMLREMKLNKKLKTITIDPDKDVAIGAHRISFFRTTHSIPDTVGLIFHTSQGAIVHTGDFKLDHTPVDGVKFDLSKLTRLGDEGVLCLLSDSKNSERLGHTPSESIVGEKLEDIFYFAEGRVITTLYASNLHRIQQVINAAVQTKRKVALENRYLERIVGIATKLGYIHVPKHTFISLDKIGKISDKETAIITTGPEGDPITPLTRIANHSHKKIEAKANDIFIYASSASPGDEKDVTKAIDDLMRLGVKVVYGESVHVSGHASSEDLKLILELVRPKYFIPIHGEFRLLKAHMDIAGAMGVPLHHVFLIEKGDVVEFSKGEARQTDKVPAGQVLVDGLGVGDVGNIVLRDRRLLAEDGTLIVVVTLGRRTKKILSGPEIITRGFVYVRESEELIEDANNIVTEVLSKALTENVSEWSSLKNGIRDALSRYLYDKTKRRPMILPIIMEI
ncbi:ribonuclease J [Pullulanibacillus pueri]|uniref:Ribonuclease J n=1 Tax=Pullulanibacillus pueri TaxID=1437324 RepID=A0A8J2ZVS9_9BACL|nr:ribonuclease J [Pullulanibacillus pueri]MBM7682532.1 ribonuclease J [Pullulanibacillus pueri]GGH82025.1 ribonuclease J [Pullulanibacillus pueri]